MKIRTGNFAFVRHAQVANWLLRGWMIVYPNEPCLGPTHGEWSRLLWRCDCWDR